MTVKQLADQLCLWHHIETSVKAILTEKTGIVLLAKIGQIPIQKSRATRRLGTYVSMGKEPVCIRLQFAQEADNLKQTFFHELAHACEHLTRKGWSQRKSRTHGVEWQEWATGFGIDPRSSGESEALRKLHQKRLKLVAVCNKCGAEFMRVRRLDKNRSYIHKNCGGKLRSV